MPIIVAEARYGYEVGRNSKKFYIYHACVACGKERWITAYQSRRPKFAGICHSCFGRKMFPHPIGSQNPAWRGGRVTSGRKYFLIMCKEHPRANAKGYVFEHVLVWERAHNMLKPKGWVVHHLNGISWDNRPENLEAMPKGLHNNLGIHLKERIRQLEAKITSLEILLQQRVA